MGNYFRLRHPFNYGIHCYWAWDRSRNTQEEVCCGSPCAAVWRRGIGVGVTEAFLALTIMFTGHRPYSSLDTTGYGFGTGYGTDTGYDFDTGYDTDTDGYDYGPCNNYYNGIC